VTAAAEGAGVDVPDDLRFSLTDAPGRDSYPICGSVWAVLYVAQTSARGRHVVDFLRWATHDGQGYCEELGYAPLPPNLIRKVEAKLESIQVGR
jgi:phosphate transport system substrate-binding protein